MMIQSHFWTVSFVFTTFMVFKFSSRKIQTKDTSTGVIASLKNVGIRLCQRKCTEYGSCVNTEYNIETLVCRLLSTEARKTEDGFIVRAKVIDGTRAIGSCKQNLRYLETRSGKTVCVQATENAPQDSPREHNTVLTAVEKGGSCELKRISGSRKDDLDPIGVEAQTLTMLAAKAGCLNMFLLFAKPGTDMTLTDKTGSNILHLAVQGGNIRIVEYILHHRDTLDVNSKDDHGQTPLMIANSKGYDRIADLIRRTS